MDAVSVQDESRNFTRSYKAKREELGAARETKRQLMGHINRTSTCNDAIQPVTRED